MKKIVFLLLFLTVYVCLILHGRPGESENSRMQHRIDAFAAKYKALNREKSFCPQVGLYTP